MRRWLKNVLIGLLAIIWTIACPLSTYAINFDFDKVAKSVVIVRCEDFMGTAVGSGFAVAEHYIATNAHVVESGGNIEIDCYSETAADNIGATFSAVCVASDAYVDIALLYVPDASFTPLELAESSTIKEGADVYAIGAPENFSYTLTKGTVSSKARIIDSVKYIQTDVGITHGSSGGPLLNEDGQVIGINTFGLSNTESIRFALHIDEVAAFLDDNLSTDMSTKTTADETISTSISSKSSKETTAAVSAAESVSGGDGGGLLVAMIVLICVLVAGVVGVLCFMGEKKTEDDRDTLHIPSATPTVVVRGNDNRANTSLLNVRADSEGTTFLRAQTEAGIRVLNGGMIGKVIPLIAEKTVIVGKDTKLADVVLDSSYGMVSRLHCSIMFSRRFNQYYVIDCSSNGTYFENGQRLTKNTRTPVPRGTELKLASDGCRIKLL